MSFSPLLLVVALGGLPLVPASAAPVAGEESPKASAVKFFESGKRIVFLGDSITFAGHYVAYVDAVLRSRGIEADILNLGLPSETVSGLSEPDHPFPRPNVHERLARVLSKTKPDVVVACYGVNDGIYHPFDEERFSAFKQGITDLIAKVRAADARLLLLTPAPFDPLPMQESGKLRPRDAEQFAWFAIYEDYDSEVLARYANWVRQQEKSVEAVVDIRTPLLAHVEKKRQASPGFTLSGDGIHVNAEGHRIIARALLDACGLKDVPWPDAASIEALTRREELLRDAWLSHVGHRRPGMKEGLPLEEATKRAATILETLKKESSR